MDHTVCVLLKKVPFLYFWQLLFEIFREADRLGVVLLHKDVNGAITSVNEVLVRTGLACQI